jgi:hypothetical protein
MKTALLFSQYSRILLYINWKCPNVLLYTVNDSEITVLLNAGIFKLQTLPSTSVEIKSAEFCEHLHCIWMFTLLQIESTIVTCDQALLIFGCEKDEYRIPLSDLSLEGIMQC